MPRLTPTQIVIMENLRQYGDPLTSFRGRAARGGAMRSFHSLERRGLVTSNYPYRLTEHGAKALTEETPDGRDAMTTRQRNDYIDDLVNEIAPQVWLRISGNGSLRIDIDTDVQCYGKFEPYGPLGAGTDTSDEVQYAQSWVQLFVRSTVNRLVDKDLLNVPEEQA